MNPSVTDLLRHFRQISIAISILCTPFTVGMVITSFRSNNPQILVLALLLVVLVATHWLGWWQAVRRQDVRWANGLATLGVLLAMIVPIYFFPNYWQVSLVLMLIPILETILTGQPKMLPGILAMTLMGVALALGIDAWFAPSRTAVVSTPISGPLLGITGVILVLGLVAALAWRQRLWGAQVTLNTQFAVLFALISGVSIVIVVGFSVVLLRSAQVQQIGQGFEQQALFSAERVGNTLEQQVNLLKLFWRDQTLLYGIRTANTTYGYSAYRPETITALRAKDQEWQAASEDSELVQQYAVTNLPSQALARFAATNPALADLIATDKLGGLVASTDSKPAHFFYGDETWWQTAWNNGQGGISFSDLKFDSAGNATLLIATIVKDPQTIGAGGSEESAQAVGVVAATYNLQGIQDYFRQQRTSTGGALMLVTPDGLQIASYGGSEAQPAWGDLPQPAILLRPKSGWEFGPIPANQPGIIGYAPLTATSGENLEPLQKLNWRALAMDSETNALQSVTYSLKSVGVVGALIVALVILAASQAARVFASPLENLTNTAAAITQGDLSKRASLSANNAIEVRSMAQAFNELTERLQKTLQDLEKRVGERTADLERRSIQIQAAAEVGQAASTILDTDQLIQQVVTLIQERFGLYYVGLFLLDEQENLAVLRAGTGQAGRAMLARHHALHVGEGMIGWSIQHGQPRIALEAENDTARLTTSELPLTRSEAAIPLRARSHIIGALSVQSELPGAFDAATIAILQTMADQVAVALSNARLFAESRSALNATQQAYGQMTRNAWANLLRSQTFRGYFCDERGLLPISEEENNLTPPNPRLIRLPIRVRGQVIGNIQANKPEKEPVWNSDEVALLESLTDQLSIALDNARLFSDAQRTAEREHILSDITAKVRTSTNVETILQTAVQELAEALKISKASIQLRSDSGPSSSGD